MDYPRIDESERIRRLTPPSGVVDMVLDTDTANEIDDQFALAYAMLSPESARVEAIHAAPFSSGRTPDPADGMQRSYDEILRLLDRLDHPHEGFAFKGSASYLPAADEPVDSPAVRDLIARALADRDGDLYVLAIGAITNVASAILMQPEIIERVVLVWLGGQPHQWPTAAEYNLRQDLHAARVVFDCGVPLVHVPCKNVSEHLRTTLAELEACIGGSRLCEYLLKIFREHHDDHFAWAKVLWDVSSVAWLVNPAWVPTVLTHSPILTDQVTWSEDRSRHLIRVATDCNRNAIFADLFRKLGAPG